MDQYILIAVVSAIAAGLTFFTGFGLGSLLLPLFVWKFGAVAAVPGVAVVHLLNSLYKICLTAKSSDFSTVLRFGIPAVISTLGGAWLLVQMTGLPFVHPFEFMGWSQAISPVKLIVGITIASIAILEASGWLKSLAITRNWLPLGGMLSGFFGGLSGHQGAFRTMFLLKAGLSKESLIGSGAVLACAIDLSRIALYSSLLPASLPASSVPILLVSSTGAFAGTTLGNRFLKKMELPVLEKLITFALVVFGICMATGLL